MSEAKWVPMQGSPRHCGCGKVFYCHGIPEKIKEFEEHLESCPHVFPAIKEWLNKRNKDKEKADQSLPKNVP